MVLPRNPYFRPYSTTSEQNMLDGLVVEFINIHGWESYYIPRVMHNVLPLYIGSDIDEYKDTYPIPVYLENATEFKGDRELYSKFSGGIQFRDQIIVSIAKTTFDEEIGRFHSMLRPREGDLIFFPFNNRIFQIKYVDKFETLFQLGNAPYCWRCTCELFEYSSEIFNTGIPEIDNIQLTKSMNLFDWAIKDTDGSPLRFETGDVWVIDTYNITNQDPLQDNTTADQFVANTVSGVTFLDPFEEGSGQI